VNAVAAFAKGNSSPVARGTTTTQEQTLGTMHTFYGRILVKKAKKSEKFKAPFLQQKNFTILYSLQDAQKGYKRFKFLLHFPISLLFRM
jgi:hypothetical protein